MTSIFGPSLSGLMAQSKRMAVSAANVANLYSAGSGDGARAAYRPQRTVNVSMAGGGVRAETVPISPATIQVFDPNHPAADPDGVVDYPNISLERELVTQIEAKQAYKANLRMIKVQDEMLGELLDVLS